MSIGTAQYVSRNKRVCKCGETMVWRWHLAQWGQNARFECDSCGHSETP